MYSARITRQHRTAFILLTDRSGSMAEEVLFERERTTKAEAVARILNLVLEELVNRCRREEGIRDYFDIAALEYSGDGVVSLLPGSGGFTTPSELIRMPWSINSRHILRQLPGGSRVSALVEHREWISPKADGDTPMGAALEEAERLARGWCSRKGNRQSFPPTVINITDGEASDACYRVLCDTAERIKSTGTEDGNTLLYNIHLARRDDETITEVSFPSTPLELPPHHYARLLWDMSSQMPSCYEEHIIASRPSATPPFRAMSFNCSMDELFSMLTIGSVSGAVLT